jgi:uncharacterized membrane protein
MDVNSTPPPTTDNDVAENKDLAAFSYLWVMSVVVFIFKRHSPFVRFHAKQAMVLFVISIIGWFIPVVGRFIELIVLVGMVYGFLAAAQGQRKDVPIIGPLSRGEITIRQAWQKIVEFCVSIFRSVTKKDTASNASTKTTPDTSATSGTSVTSSNSRLDK